MTRQDDARFGPEWLPGQRLTHTGGARHGSSGLKADRSSGRASQVWTGVNDENRTNGTAPMTRFCLRFLMACLALLAVPAFAHPGHLSGLAGHDHWVAGAAIGLAIALGLYGALKGRKSGETSEEEAEEASDEDTAEAPA